MFKVNDKVVYIGESDFNYTDLKRYNTYTINRTIKLKSNSLFLILSGESGYYYSTYFIKLKEYRKQKLNKLW